MLDLNGLFPFDTIKEIIDYTNLRLQDSVKYTCAEALCIYEQKLLPNDKLLELCEKAAGVELIVPTVSYIPEEIVRHFHGTDIVPVSYSPIRRVVTCVALPEIGTKHMVFNNNIDIDIQFTTIYHYFEEYIKHYGYHPDLLEVPAKRLLDSIVNEAITIGASDMTISSIGRRACVYYNVRKKKVYSQRILSGDNLNSIIKLMCFESPIDLASRAPKYVGITLNEEWRGRVVINRKYHGYAITTRLLPNAAFDKTLDDLNLTKETVKFFRQFFINREAGLRLIVGSTMSGKNTTALACLHDLTEEDKYKVVSVEMPVEQTLDGIEQINCDTDEEYRLNIESLIRQNPDLVYLTEIGDSTGSDILKMSNTGKRVISTLHANSVSDTIGRLQDITGFSTDRIIQSVHSIVYQELVRDEESDKVYPKNRFVYLSADRKAKLFGLSFGDIILKIREWEGGDVW